MSNLSSFDLDFEYGQYGEQLVEELLTGGKTIEVKRDRKWKDTGNLYVETECYFVKRNGWFPSGINVTEAAYWAFVLEDSVLMVPTDALKYAVTKFGEEIECSIPPNKSKGFLLTVHQLLKATKEYRNER
jgi:hypothetical protein